MKIQTQLATALVALAAAQPALAAAPLSLRFIGEEIIPSGTQYEGTTVGGLSGIDYQGNGSYIAIADDRSQINPARFYTLDLELTSEDLTGVTFTSTETLKTPAGGTYPILTVDPEAIRMLDNGNFIYTSEGDVNNSIDAFIREANADGSYVRDLTVPAIFQQTGPAGATGIRNNLAFESLTLSADETTAYVAVENALKQDGPPATLTTGSPVRILTLDVATGTPGAQYVYEVDPVQNTPVPDTAFANNGLVELLDIGNGQLIAVEREFSTGASQTGNSIQLFLIDLAGATDVSGLDSLDGETYTAVSKTLLFDLDDLGIPLDNIEGITFGETLENGSRSLILVSDNNFSGTQFTQFLAFEITAAAVPEPASWAMMIAGFGLVGGAMRRRAVKVALAA